jgi:hypothetical protein
MNAEHKKFIRTKLIPFILREQGRGFAMEDWCNSGLAAGETWRGWQKFEVSREVPKCGTVACIGGSVCHLSGEDITRITDTAEYIGLTKEQGYALFYGVSAEFAEPSDAGLWPERFRTAYVNRKTPLGKAKVAVALLREVMRTNGKCLEGNK